MGKGEYIRWQDLKPRDRLYLVNEDTGKKEFSTVAYVNGENITFTDGLHLKVYEEDSMVEVFRLRVVK